MELPREYDKWKTDLVPTVVADLPPTAAPDAIKNRSSLKRAFAKAIDCLWWESTMDVVAQGDVYNPGGRSKIPRLFTIDSRFEQPLEDLGEHEAFGLAKRDYRVINVGCTKADVQIVDDREVMTLPSETRVLKLQTGEEKALIQLEAGDHFKPMDLFEILIKKRNAIVVRSSRGFVIDFPGSTKVFRLSNLSRGPNGVDESKVALSSFPVAHVVSNRTLWIRRQTNFSPFRQNGGHITALVGDLMASPHFMVRRSNMHSLVIYTIS